MTTDVDNFLEHYGVKGMKWGVSRAAGGVKGAVGKVKAKRAAVKKERKENSSKAAEAGYTSIQRRADVANIGNRGTRKVEKRIANGESINKARAKEYGKSAAKGFAVGTAMLAGPVALYALDKGAGNLAKHINGKRGAAAAAKIFADGKGLTSYKTVGLAFDAATNTFK